VGQRVLFIGGSGIICSASKGLPSSGGFDVTVLNHGNDRREVPHEVEQLVADLRDPRSVREVIRGRTFDVVADWCQSLPSG
jgi:nucleoside-diphosphate-sugar epimerase